MIRLQNPVKEEGTVAITLSWFDEEGNATTPSAATWTLTDTFGNIKNSREDVAITSISTSNTVVLSGDDLKVNGARTELVMTLNAVYDSANGSDLPLPEEIRFWVDNLITIGSGD